MHLRTLYFDWAPFNRFPMPAAHRLFQPVPPANYGGLRWWLHCPLVRAGRPCSRRQRMLYLPNGATYFGCRDCHRLTYDSCQESHRFDRLYCETARRLDISIEWLKANR